MNRYSALKKVLMLSVIAVIAVAVLKVNRIIGFAGSGFGGFGGNYHTGEGTITEPVRNLEIDWTSGVISIEYHNDDSVILRESANKKISRGRQMQWELDGDTLRIRYDKPGIHLFSFMPGLRKELTLTLPEGIALKNAGISATSGEIHIPQMQAEELKLDVTSGEIIAATEAQNVNCEATSGLIQLETSGEAEKISASATSGSISITAENADNITTDMTSGDVCVDVKKAGAVKASVTSGDILLKAGSLETLDVDGTSGDVTVALSKDQGFTAKLDTTSGKITCDQSVKKDGKVYVYGDGSGTVKIDTTSGDIRIEELKD